MKRKKRLKLHSIIDTDFPLWDLALLWRAESAAGKKSTKKLVRQLMRAAKLWLPYEFYDAPWGNYWFLFSVEMEMERRWKFREFREGIRFGKNPREPYRDANPYSEAARRRSWDLGYILGLGSSKGEL